MIDVLEAAKAIDPSIRRTDLVGYVLSTSCRKIVQCMACGAEQSCCAKWKDTKRFNAFRFGHSAICDKAIEFREGLKAGRRIQVRTRMGCKMVEWAGE